MQQEQDLFKEKFKTVVQDCFPPGESIPKINDHVLKRMKMNKEVELNFGSPGCITKMA